MSESLPQEYPYSVAGGDETIMASDFDDRIDVVPVSNPNAFSQAQRITLAQTKLQLASQAPEIHNMHEAFRDMYEAIGVRDIDTILNTQDIDKPKDPAGENSQSLDGSPLKAYAGQQHDAHIQTHILFALSPMVAQMPNVGTVLLKHILEHVKLKAEETVEAELFTQYGTDPDRMVSALQREAMIAIKVAQFYQEVKDLQSQLSGEGQEKPDPLIELKKQELAQSAQRDQNKAQMDQARISLDQQKEQNDVSYDQARISTQQQLANERNRLTLMQMQQRGGQNG